MGHLTMLTTITEVSQNWTTSNFTATPKKLPCCGAATLEQTCLLTTPWKVFTRHRWAVTFTTLHLGLNFLWRSSRQNHAGPSLCWFTFKTSPLYLKDPQQFVDQKHIALHNSRGVFFFATLAERLLVEGHTLQPKYRQTLRKCSDGLLSFCFA